MPQLEQMFKHRARATELIYRNGIDVRVDVVERNNGKARLRCGDDLLQIARRHCVGLDEHPGDFLAVNQSFVCIGIFRVVDQLDQDAKAVLLGDLIQPSQDARKVFIQKDLTMRFAQNERDVVAATTRQRTRHDVGDVVEFAHGVQHALARFFC